MIIKDGRMWTHWSIILILAYSILVALLSHYIKVNNFLITSIIYYVVSISAFMTLTVLIADYREKNYSMILFGAFTVFFVFYSIVHFFIKRKFYRFENDEKEYKRQFD